jgi:hypothetical protein
MTFSLRFFLSVCAVSLISGCMDSAIKPNSTNDKAALAAPQPPPGPFTCTELIGMYTSGEWYDAGFEEALGKELADRWQGRFSHYGYMMEYAKPNSYSWSPVTVGGVDSSRLTAPCEQSGNAPDRIVYQAWSWDLTTEEAWITSLEAALTMIRTKRPSAKRIDIMTIVRCPSNGFCHADKPPHGPGADRDASRQDCHVPEYVDSALLKVAANHPELVSIAPKFEAHTCNPDEIDGIHLGVANAPVAKDIAEYYKANP